MRSKRNLRRLGLIALLGLASPAAAESLGVQFNLLPANASRNTVPISISASYNTGIPLVGVVTASDSATSTISGNALADLDLSFDADGNITALSTIAFTGGRVQFDSNLSFDLDFPLSLASVDIDLNNLAGQILTPGAPGPINTGVFGLAAHQLNVNEGTMAATGSGLASDVNLNMDFSTAPLSAPLEGSANISVQLDQVINGVGHYTATINAPFVFNETLDEIQGAGASLSTNGTLVAEASFTRALPAPGDFDGDGDIDGVDLGVVFATFTGPGLGPPANPAADFDKDGDVDGVDLAQVFGTFTGPLAPASVPEPGTAVLFAGFGLLISRRR